MIDFTRNETRFRMVEQQDPARFKDLMELLQSKSDERRALYSHMALPVNAAPVGPAKVQPPADKEG